MKEESVDIAALASLARISVSDEERTSLQKEISDILSFVKDIQTVATSDTPSSPALRNVMREDVPSHEAGAHTHDLLVSAPVSKDGYIAVKQVVSRKR